MQIERNEQSKNCTILYVDDEENSLKYFSRVFCDQFTVLTAENTPSAYHLLLQHRDKIGVLLADQRMPGEKGLDFLRRTYRLHPDAVRILTTAYSDSELINEALTSSWISTVVMKPWDIPALEAILKRACELYRQQREGTIDTEAELRPPRVLRSSRGVALLTVEDVARYLNVDKFTVYRLITHDKLPAFKVGNQWRFKQELVDEWLQDRLNIRR
jgi:two-component system probable response regulator PhcQ